MSKRKYRGRKVKNPNGGKQDYTPVDRNTRRARTRNAYRPNHRHTWKDTGVTLLDNAVHVCTVSGCTARHYEPIGYKRNRY